MLSAGMAPEAALTALRTRRYGAGRPALADAILLQVHDGAPLAPACAKASVLFTPLFSAMLKAGEARGRFPEALAAVADLIESQLRTHRKIVLALVYPTMALLLAVAVAGFLVLAVTPRLSRMYHDCDATLPPVTTSLIATADAIGAHAVAGAIGLVCIGLLPAVLSRSRRWRVWFDWLKLKVPLVGGFNRKRCSARFARAYGALMSGGVDIGRALKLAGPAMGNLIAEQVIVNAGHGVAAGRPLSAALNNIELLDPQLLSAIETGERSGRGDELLAHVADALEAEIAHALSILMVCLPLGALCLVAAMVAWIALAIAVPWFTLSTLFA